MANEDDNKNGWDEHKRVIVHRLNSTDGRLDKISTKLGDLIDTRLIDVTASRKERADQFQALHNTIRELQAEIITYELAAKEEIAICKTRLNRVEKVVYGTFGIVGTSVGLYVVNSLLNLI